MSNAMQLDTHRGMKHVGSLNSFPKLSVIVSAIFDRQARTTTLPNGEVVRCLSWVGGTVRAIEHRGLRYIEQNPNKKNSAPAARAKQGARIVWVTKSGAYIGKIENGEVYHK